MSIVALLIINSLPDVSRTDTLIRAIPMHLRYVMKRLIRGAAAVALAVTSVVPAGSTLASEGCFVYVTALGSGDQMVNYVGKVSADGFGDPEWAIVPIGAFFMDVGPNGDVYVAALASEHLIRITPDGSVDTEWAKVGEAAYQVEVDQAGNVYVATKDNGVVKILPDGLAKARWFDVPGARPQDASFSISIAVHPSGNIVAAYEDGPTSTVTLLTPEGSVVTSWSGVPVNRIATAPDGTIYLFDSLEPEFMARITPDGTLEPEWVALPGKAWDMVVAPDGAIVVADEEDGRLTRIHPDGQVTAGWARVGPGMDRVAIDGQGHVYATGGDSNMISRVSPDGSSVDAEWFSTAEAPLDIDLSPACFS